MLAKVLAEILNNHLTLRDNDLLIGASRRDSNDWRLSKRMNRFQVRPSAEVCIALEDLDVVGKVEFFQQPNDALATRFGKPGWN